MATATAPPATNIARCPECRLETPVRSDHRIRVHWRRNRSRQFGFPPCAGSEAYTRNWVIRLVGRRWVRVNTPRGARR